MSKTFTHTYTPDRLAAMQREKLLTLRENAVRHSAYDLVHLCDSELHRRTPVKPRRAANSAGPRNGDVIIGYHFVCAKDRGVIEDGHGRFRSGSWVVAESNIQQSLQHGAYLALHETKNLRSYRHGQIVGYRVAPRDMVEKDNFGIEFVVQETSDSYEWVGGGSGEKGYNWKYLADAGAEADTAAESE